MLDTLVQSQDRKWFADESARCSYHLSIILGDGKPDFRAAHGYAERLRDLTRFGHFAEAGRFTWEEARSAFDQAEQETQ